MAGEFSIEQRRKAIQSRIAALNHQHYRDVDKFNAAIQEIARLKTEEEALLIVQKVVIDVYARIVDRTPVDTGRARASWQFGVNTEPEGKVAEGDYRAKIAGIVAENIAQIADAPAAVWFISNHLDYIEALEAGWSKQAPAGMVGLTLRELTRQLEGVKI